MLTAGKTTTPWTVHHAVKTCTWHSIDYIASSAVDITFHTVRGTPPRRDMLFMVLKKTPDNNLRYFTCLGLVQR